jgi:hypothetical protein
VLRPAERVRDWCISDLQCPNDARTYPRGAAIVLVPVPDFRADTWS